MKPVVVRMNATKASLLLMKRPGAINASGPYGVSPGARRGILSQAGAGESSAMTNASSFTDTAPFFKESCRMLF